jgi:WD40 repeat protein
MRNRFLPFLFFAGAGLAAAQKPELIAQPEGHLSEVYHVCFSPDERQALSADRSDRIVLWDLHSGKFVRFIPTGAAVDFLDFSSDGLDALAILSNRTLNAWNLASGERRWQGSLSGDTVVAARISSDRRSLAICFRDRSVECWDLAGGRRNWQKKPAGPAPALVFFSADDRTVEVMAADGRSLAAFQTEAGARQPPKAQAWPATDSLAIFGGGRAVGLAPGSLRWLDLPAGSARNLPHLRQAIDRLGLPISDFAVSRDGHIAVVALGTPTIVWSTTPGAPYNRTGNGTVLFWDMPTDRLLHRIDTLPEIVNALDLSADGALCLSASSDRTLRMWELPSGRERLRLERKPAVETIFRFTSDFRHLAMADMIGGFRTWELARPANPVDWRGQSFPNLPDGWNYLNALAFGPDDRSLVTAARYPPLRLWNSRPPEPVAELLDRHHCLEVTTALAFSPDGQKLLAGSSKEWRFMFMSVAGIPRDSVLRYITNAVGDTIGLTTREGDHYGKFGHNALVDPGEAPDTAFFLPNYFNVSLWDLKTGRSERVFYTGVEEWHPVSDVRFSPDGRLAIAAVADKTLAWDIETGARVVNELGMDYFHAAAWGSLPGRAATIGPDSTAVTIWNLSDGKVRVRLKGTSRVVAAAFHPGGPTVCTLGAGGVLTEWDGSTGAILRKIGGAPSGTFLEYAPDPNFVVIRGEGRVAVWNLATGKSVLELGELPHGGTCSGLFFDGHQAEQISLFEFLPDGRRAVSASYDGTLRFWNGKSGQEICTVFFPGANDWVATTPAGLFDASPGAMDQMYYRVGTEVIEMEQLKERYYEPGLLQKLLGFAPGELRDVEGFAAVELYPQIRARIDRDTLRVALTARNGGIGKLSLFINGKEVQQDINPWRRSNLALGLAGFARYFRTDTVNRVALRAYNAGDWLKSQAYPLEYRPFGAKGFGDAGGTGPGLPLSSPPALFALMVGTSDYAGSALDLRFADKDAAAMAQAIRSAGGALFPAGRIQVELLSTAGDSLSGTMSSSKNNIRKAFEAVAGRAKPGDLFLVYFSGHGVTYGSAEKASFYYLTKDIAGEDLHDPEIRQNFAISSEELTQWLTAIPALKQVMILDACNSGQVVEAFTARDLNPSQIRAFDRMKDRTGMFILTGSAADKVSYEANRYGQGLLTYSLLQGMSGLALTPDKRVDVMTLFQYARDKVPELARGVGGIQTPVLAFPAQGESFDIGIVTDQVKIPVTQVKPVFIRNNFQDQDAYDDVLGLTEAVAVHFQGLTARGAQAKIIYVDVSEYENAYSIKGRYTVKGENVVVRGRLFQGKTAVGDFKVNGTKNAFPALVEALVEKVSVMVE